MKKRKQVKIFMAFVLALTIFFSVLVLSACDKNPPLEQQVDALGQQVKYMQENGSLSLDEIDMLLEKLANLRAKLQNLENANAALLERIVGYESQLKGIRSEYTLQCEWVDTECGRFSLSIHIKKTTIFQGESFTVYVWLKNLSDYDIEISYLLRPNFQNNTIFWPIIEGYNHELENADSARGYFTLAGGEYFFAIIQEESLTDFIIKVFWGIAHGDYNFKIRSFFYLNYGELNQEIIDFMSNTIVITIEALPVIDDKPPVV